MLPSHHETNITSSRSPPDKAGCAVFMHNPVRNHISPI
ncbi:hypothetical protein LLB_2639 [Legionella longbeachae D-4968]|nr:hypothetical protein LLB_2639 [Legionella longbeachae D-4968]